MKNCTNYHPNTKNCSKITEFIGKLSNFMEKSKSGTFFLSKKEKKKKKKKS